MKNLLRTLPILILLMCPIYCLGQTHNGPADIREGLASSAKKADKDFPDGKDVLLTHFSYLGKLQTKKGVIYVADMRSVLNNMNAPRGVNYIMFFDNKYEFLGKQNYASSVPLWCEEGRLFLFGDLDGFSDRGDGNVIDLSDGYKNMRIYHEKRYGSSGGINDD
ncbi:MAG TPA: hypothetical protein VGA95_00545 [Thermodesulfobacteriota bacterium]